MATIRIELTQEGEQPNTLAPTIRTDGVVPRVVDSQRVDRLCHDILDVLALLGHRTDGVHVDVDDDGSEHRSDDNAEGSSDMPTVGFEFVTRTHDCDDCGSYSSYENSFLFDGQEDAIATFGRSEHFGDGDTAESAIEKMKAVFEAYGHSCEILAVPPVTGTVDVAGFCCGEMDDPEDASRLREWLHEQSPSCLDFTGFSKADPAWMRRFIEEADYGMPYRPETPAVIASPAVIAAIAASGMDIPAWWTDGIAKAAGGASQDAARTAPTDF